MTRLLRHWKYVAFLTVPLWAQTPEDAVAKQRDAAAAMQESLAKQRSSVQRQQGMAGGGSFFSLPRAASLGGVTGSLPAPAAMPLVADCDPLPAPKVDSLLGETAQREGVPADLLRSVMKQESGFRPCAVSSQGAMGLMQLMPATAEKMGASLARHRGAECPDQLMDPETNLGFGQSYVHHLAEQPMIGDNLMLLLTAYNGGPGRLSQRGGIDGNADPLLFMESLPAQETHDYVQQVLVQYWTYRARLHQPLQSLAQLAHGEWPRFALRDTGVRSASNAVAAEGFDVASNTTVH